MTAMRMATRMATRIALADNSVCKTNKRLSRQVDGKATAPQPVKTVGTGGVGNCGSLLAACPRPDQTGSRRQAVR